MTTLRTLSSKKKRQEPLPLQESLQYLRFKLTLFLKYDIIYNIYKVNKKK